MIRTSALAVLIMGAYQLPLPPPFLRLQGLYDAVRRGDARFVSAALDAGLDVNRPYSDGETLLMRAVADGRRPMVELLLRRGADVDRGDAAGCTALCFATKEQLVDDLLRNGAKVDGVSEGTPPVVSAARGSSRVLARLINAGAKIDLPDRWGVTALIAAARQGKVDNVRLLLRAGAEPETMDKHGFRAVDFAKHQRRRDIIELLGSHMPHK